MKGPSLRHVFVHGTLVVISAAVLLPIVYALSVSLSGTNTFLSTEFLLWPTDPTLEHYRSVLFDQPFFQWFGNSLLLSVLTVLFALFVSVPAGYAFSRWKFRGQHGLLILFLLLNAFPAVLTMVGVYRLFRLLELMNSYQGLILLYTGMMVIFGIWNMKGYFDTLPTAMEEAAAIDGCSPWGTLWRIVVPMALPAVVVTGTLIFITAWNEYIYAINFLTDRDKFTLAAGLYSLQGTEFTRNWPQFAAGSLLVTLPVLAVFFAVQRFLVGGLSAGGSKF